MSTPQQPNSQTYTQGFGSSSLNVQTPHLDVRNPSSSDVVGFPVGKKWVNTVGNTTWSLTSFSASAGITSATWVVEGGGSSALATLTGNSGGAISPAGGNINILGAGALAFAGLGSTLTGSITPGTALLATLTGDSGGAISPTAGNITTAGTANQITTTGAGSTITWSLPAAITAPGSLTTTTTLTAGTGLTVSAGGAAITGTSTINTTGAGNTTIGTGGTGTVSIGNATGNTSVTGTLTTSGAISATTGNITATNGDISIGAAGHKLFVATGANASIGTSGAMTAGSVTVANTAVTANSFIFCYIAALGTVALPQAYYISARTAGTSFTITSGNVTDTSTWNYWIIN